MEKIRKILALAEKEVLIDIVKNVQKRKMKGAKGEWKEFLVEYDSQLGDSLLDPNKRPPACLVAFLNTFTKEQDLEFFEKIMTYHSNRKAIEQLNKSCIDVQSSPQKLASLTFEHPEYPKCFSFPSYDEDWVMTKIGKVSKAIKSTRMLSVDCEMVLCEDKTESLVQVCVVNRNLEVKLNELVKLDKPVLDYRTQIHGINAKDLERATCSLEDIQKSMKKLLSDGVVLIGHSLDKDLKALKVDHSRVIDTSLIFKYPEGHTHKRPSLNHLCKTVLGYDLRESGAPHNCLADAQAAMKLVLAKLENKFDVVIPLKIKEVLESDGVIPLKRKKVLESDGFVPMKSKDVFEIESVELFFHEVPIAVPQKQLRRLFPEDSTVKLQASLTGDAYNSSAVFKDSMEACNAFESFKGEEGKDSSGVPQKLISLDIKYGKRAGSVSFYVHKVLKKVSSDKNPADEGSIQFEETKEQNKKPIKNSDQRDQVKEIQRLKKDLSDRSPADKRSIQVEETKDQNKKQKKHSDQCDHDEEIQRLKKEIKGRESELTKAHNIMADLIKKRGL
ncbi:small RNA degrading nuclease 1-like isoform X2 [Papaver somniferum]|uniref:small RNA degrading nuclease 1-like isoform X2 n=1 Tax=Papaver somniferum TaxID=3469 RepID=UPI000E6F4F01|nr:small RNA degrading nuclease 1-like isoform X2 [Papaver somniferum]